MFKQGKFMAEKIHGKYSIKALSLATILIGAAACTSPNNNGRELRRDVADNYDGRSITGVCVPISDVEDWQAVPPIVDIGLIAKRLGKTPNDIAHNALLGSVECNRKYNVDQISSQEPPIVSVKSIRNACLVFGTLVQPKPGLMVSDVLVVCPTNGTKV